ncbi:molybdopterin synthase catalytic subunit MoaE [Oceanimonas baumannii]|uniref:Molybdopterin synthase catalytic subunit n=1 Tax=Oceanimonas baumannii TaxID=129578 RepID=A0A235CEM6_9GAMM|nr:molybdopterin synthase catalytic subunit MoaE [Oceanimonas baumannii]OYD23071.1 molybdopterin synthase catalytic subunit [Oceanimonas baumannii]TDW58337.1 molybdopterin synthase catalytic subunit [Oceanimonas baumannii]
MIRVQTDDFCLATEYAALSQSHQTGAVVTFVGKVRDMNQGSVVSGMTLEHYPGMTEHALQQIVAEAKQRWPLLECRVIHRVGALALGDQIVFVGVASQHREAAFAACHFIMDYLKTRAPFWKKERTADGERWVEAKDSDTDAAKKW